MSFNKYRLKGAYHYDWYETEPWYKECVDTIVDFCKGSTLDVGCGDGLLTKKIAENGFEVEGVDIDEDGLALARQKTGLPAGKFILKDIQRPFHSKYGLKKWDYIASLNVIEHLDNPSCLLRLIRNHTLKGAIIITNQYQGGSLGEDHRKEYDYQELIDFFKEFKPEGFKLADGEYIGVKIKL